MEENNYTLEEKKELAHQIKPFTKEEAVEDFKKLRKLDLDKVTYNTRIGNKMVDYYTLFERLDTKGKQGISFYDLYFNRKKIGEKKYIKKIIEYTNIKYKNKRNEPQIWSDIARMYYSSINCFKPSIAMQIYNMYKPKSVLDFTMGWGGRLIGACAYNVPMYIGIDANKNLIEPYKKMIDDLEDISETKIHLIFGDALKVDYSKLDYDLVLTSPPYYNLEIYNGSKKMTKEEWNEKFYFPLFLKTFKCLKMGGHYCINVNEEIYEKTLLILFGKAHYEIPLSTHPRKPNTKYKECIYVWKR